jgi:histidinol-phosphate/aromatic aminotransferase/cobyric acid decarboxylase-like protein
MGGLRLGYCVASEALSPRVRAAVPPMLATSLSLRLGRAILSLGDITRTLREWVEVARAEAMTLLDEAGFTAPTPASTHLPLLFYPSEDAPAAVGLRARGVLGKRHIYWSERHRGNAVRYRLSVPLRHDRMVSFRVRLGLS